MLKRLQDKQPTYSAAKWEDEFKEKLGLFNLVCEYPFQLQSDGSYVRSIQTAGGEYVSDNGSNLPRIGTSQSNTRGARGFSSSGMDRGGHKSIIRQADSLDENRIVLYKKGQQLGNGYFIVEISSNN